MKTRLPKSFFFGFLFSLVSLSVPVVAAAVSAGGLSAYPTKASDTDPRTKSWFIYSIPAGDTRQGSVTVVNTGTEPVTVKIYPADSTKTQQGDFALKNEDEPRTDIGSWVKLDTSELTLAPNERRDISFIISIPPGATGEHSGGIVIQNTKPKMSSKNGMGINIISRIGVRIYEEVPGDEQLNMAVRNLNYTVVNGNLTFNFTIENKGTVHVQPKGILEVNDIFGRPMGRIILDNILETVVPGQPYRVSVPTRFQAPLLGWNSVNVAIYYSPTKAAVASLTYMPHHLGIFLILFIIAAVIAFVAGKKYLVVYKGKTHKMKLAPHIQIIVGCILLGAIAFSLIVSYLLNLFFSGR